MKLSTAQNKLIEEYWMNIGEYQEKLKFREWQLMENKTNDTNTGGGKSSNISDPTSQKAILLAEDKEYQHYKRVIDAVLSVYKSLDGELKSFADIRYFSDDTKYLYWDVVAERMRTTKPKIYCLRNQLIDMTAKELGWL